MKQLMVSETWLYKYRFYFGYFLLTVSVATTMFYRLGTLVPGVNEAESLNAVKSMDLSAILSSPVDFSYHLLQYIFIGILGPTALAMRLPGVFIGLATLGLFFHIVNSRFSKRAALVATFLLATSSWYLNYARLGTSSSLLIFFVLLLIFGATRLDDKYSLLRLLTLVAAAAVSLYTPYFLYLLVAGIVFSVPSIKRRLKYITTRDLALGIGLFLVLIAPLAYSMIYDVDIAKVLLAIPDNLPTPIEYWQNVMSVVGHILWSSEALPVLHLGTLPMLEIFSVSMVALGLYHYDHELSRNLSRIVLGGLLVVILLLGMNGNQLDYALMLPFVYFLLAGGLVILFTQWNEIFPKNPIARVIAIIPIGILLVIVTGYHTERYFIAWPNTPEVVAQHSEAYTKLEGLLNEQSVDSLVLNSESERIVMLPLDIFYDEVIFVSHVDDRVETPEAGRLIITNKAYDELNLEMKNELGEVSATVAGQYPSQPIVLWVFNQ